MTDTVFETSISQKIAEYIKARSYSSGTSNTVFDCEREPGIGITDYIERIQRHTRCTDDVLVIAMCYMLRIVNKGRISLTNENTHRLLLGCCTIAYKWNEDVCYNNPYCAKVGGVRKEELVDIEMTILKLMDYNAYVDKTMCKETVEELYKNQISLD
jgi:hypothetical protein